MRSDHLDIVGQLEGPLERAPGDPAIEISALTVLVAILAGHGQRIALLRVAMPPHGSAVVLGALGKLAIIHINRAADGRRGEPEQQPHGEAW